MRAPYLLGKVDEAPDVAAASVNGRAAWGFRCSVHKRSSLSHAMTDSDYLVPSGAPAEDSATKRPVYYCPAASSCFPALAARLPWSALTLAGRGSGALQTHRSGRCQDAASAAHGPHNLGEEIGRVCYLSAATAAGVSCRWEQVWFHSARLADFESLRRALPPTIASRDLLAQGCSRDTTDGGTTRLTGVPCTCTSTRFFVPASRLHRQARS